MALATHRSTGAEPARPSLRSRPVMCGVRRRFVPRLAPAPGRGGSKSFEGAEPMNRARCRCRNPAWHCNSTCPLSPTPTTASFSGPGARDTSPLDPLPGLGVRCEDFEQLTTLDWVAAAHDVRPSSGRRLATSSERCDGGGCYTGHRGNQSPLPRIPGDLLPGHRGLACSGLPARALEESRPESSPLARRLARSLGMVSDLGLGLAARRSWTHRLRVQGRRNDRSLKRSKPLALWRASQTLPRCQKTPVRS